MQLSTWARRNAQFARCQAAWDNMQPPEYYEKDCEGEDEPAWANYEPEVIDDTDNY